MKFLTAISALVIGSAAAFAPTVSNSRKSVVRRYYAQCDRFIGKCDIISVLVWR